MQYRPEIAVTTVTPLSRDQCSTSQAMTAICPICKSPAQELSRFSDATGFHCPTHGDFKVADTTRVDEYYTRAEWEVALLSAKYKAMKGEWPVIRRGDFFR